MKASGKVFQDGPFFQYVIDYFSTILNRIPQATKDSNNANAINTEQQKNSDCIMKEEDGSDIISVDIHEESSQAVGTDSFGVETPFQMNNPSGTINNNYNSFINQFKHYIFNRIWIKDKMLFRVSKMIESNNCFEGEKILETAFKILNWTSKLFVHDYEASFEWRKMQLIVAFVPALSK